MNGASAAKTEAEQTEQLDYRATLKANDWDLDEENGPPETAAGN